MRAAVVLTLVVLVIVGTALADDTKITNHRFCGGHADCRHTDKEKPEECCIRGKMNNYHECLVNPKPGQLCGPETF